MFMHGFCCCCVISCFAPFTPHYSVSPSLQGWCVTGGVAGILLAADEAHLFPFR